MKKNLKMHPGFTLAELLISLLTVSLIATALVPIIGPKKITNPDPKHLHGIAECYWEGDTLMYYYADNKTNRNAQPIPANASYCTFEPPKADHIEVFAIGAGSNGATDPTQIWTNIDSTTPSFSGNISLENWSYDTNQGIANIVGNKRYTMVDNNGTDFVATLKESFTRWAIMLNYSYFNRFNGTVFDTNNTFENPSDWPYTDSGRYLYAEFRGLRGPIGKAGNGLSEAKIIGGDFPSADDRCETRCTNYTNPKCTLQAKLSGNNAPWWRGANYYVQNGVPSNDEISATITAQENNNCYFYLNYLGGNSAEPIRVSNIDTPVLFPIDGTSNINLQAGNPMRDNGNTTNYEPEGDSALAISINARGTIGANGLRLGSSAPGKNATTTSDGQSLSNDNTGTFASIHLNNIGANKPKYGVNGTNLDKDSHFGTYNDNPNGVRNGMKHGLLYGPGGVQEPEIKGMQGNLGIARPGNAFTWRYVEPKVDIKYGRAGTPGAIKVLSFPHLTNNLYLSPGRNNQGDISDTVVSTTEDGSRILLTAPSPHDVGELDDINNGYATSNYAIAESDNAATPPKRILNEAIPQNWRLANYVNKMRSLAVHGITGGLYGSCIENNSCPGFGGAGIYPMVVSQSYQNTLIITNNQPYADSPGYSEFKTYRRALDTNITNNPVCAEGYSDPNAENESDGVLHYCTSENPVRRDGAVIIIW